MIPACRLQYFVQAVALQEGVTLLAYSLKTFVSSRLMNKPLVGVQAIAKLALARAEKGKH